jgi:hypothetical protein
MYLTSRFTYQTRLLAFLRLVLQFPYLAHGPHLVTIKDLYNRQLGLKPDLVEPVSTKQ